jgi:hypothetical protein
MRSKRVVVADWRVKVGYNERAGRGLRKPFIFLIRV